MKVIKKGNDLAPLRRITCKKCECIFEYDSNDIKLEKGDGYFGDYYYVVCPNNTCNQRHKVYKIN